MLAHNKRWTAGFAGLVTAAMLLAAAPAPVVYAAAPAAPAASAQATLSNATELDAVLYMREEEKLAHDVYVTLYEKWQLPVFATIARSESQHMSMMLALLEAHGLADPAAGKGVGEFANAELQALYADLIALGSESQVAALQVGATIEDLDISDLQAALKNAGSDDVRFALQRLQRGSENHLRAFVRNLARTGDVYEAQYLDQATFDAIVAGRSGRSGSMGQAGAWGRGAAPQGRGARR